MATVSGGPSPGLSLATNYAAENYFLKDSNAWSTPVETPPVLPRRDNTMVFTTDPFPAQVENLSQAVSYAFSGPVVMNSIDHGSVDRGAGGTGREENLGTSPVDGMGVGFDYFEKIFLIPTTLDLGNIVSNLNFDVELQNTYRRSAQTLTSIVNTAGTGVTISPDATPINLSPLSTREFVLTVTAAGPPTIEGTVSFVTGVRTAVLTLSGNRIVLVQEEPQRPAGESLEWLTDVIRTANGYEQRHAVRTYPRRKIALEYFFTEQDVFAKFTSLLTDWTSRTFGIPLWWETRSLSADAASAQASVSVGSGFEYSEFKVGGLAMVYQDNADGSRTAEVLQILTVDSPAGLTFTSNLTNSYDADSSFVVPVLSCTLEAPMRQSTPASALGTTFTGVFRAQDNISVIDAEQTIYQTLDNAQGEPAPILDDDNILEQGNLSEDWQQALQYVDEGTGPFTLYSQELLARRSSPFTWLAETAAEMYEIKRLFYYLRGRLRNAWVPTFREDFILAEDAADSANAIKVYNTDAWKYHDGAPPFNGLVIRRLNGTVSYHRITGIADATTESPAAETVSITPAISGLLETTAVDRIELMHYVRLNTDRVEIEHRWNGTDDDNMDSVVRAGFIGDIVSNT